MTDPCLRNTAQIHAGANPDQRRRCGQTPIYQTTAYVFPDPSIETIIAAATLTTFKEVGLTHLFAADQPGDELLGARRSDPNALQRAGRDGLLPHSGHAEPASWQASSRVMVPGKNIVASTGSTAWDGHAVRQTIRRFGLVLHLRRFRTISTRSEVAMTRTPRAIFCESIAEPGVTFNDCPGGEWPIAGAAAGSWNKPLPRPSSAARYDHGATLVVNRDVLMTARHGSPAGRSSIRGNFDWWPRTSVPSLSQPAACLSRA